MRISISFILAGMVFSGAALAADEESPVVMQKAAAPSLTAIQPKNPAAAAPGGPVIQSIGARLPPTILNVTPEVLLIDFHYTAPNGDAAILHRELVQTSGSVKFTENLPINTPADGQKLGATISNNWTCANGQYYVTLRAYIMDAQGNHSNDVQYTVHCNGG